MQSHGLFNVTFRGFYSEVHFAMFTDDLKLYSSFDLIFNNNVNACLDLLALDRIEWSTKWHLPINEHSQKHWKKNN